MKTKIEIKKIEFSFDINLERFTVRWLYLGKEMVNCINYKKWRVLVIIYNDGSGLLNKICDTSYDTTLQPNLTNSIGYLYKIL